MAVGNSLHLAFIALVTIESQLCCLQQLVGNAAKRANHYYYRLTPCLSFHNIPEAKNTFHGTYRRSAKFHYFHFFVYFIKSGPSNG